jgi:cytochrome d ubiquinol oxidase subunit II
VWAVFGWRLCIARATWLVLKTEGPVAHRARSEAKVPLWWCSPSWRGDLWTPLSTRIAERWFSHPNFIPLAGAAGDGAHRLFGLALARRRRESAAISRAWRFPPRLYRTGTYPAYLVPPSLTIWDTAAAPASQIFMLLGTLLLLPIVLGYVAFIYWLFRGKVREGESYH